MAARAMEDLKLGLIKTFTVADGGSTKGMLQVFDTGAIEDAGANVKGICVALEDGVEGDQIQAVMLAGACIVKVLVGTGGATQGEYLKTAADGVTDAGALGGGTTSVEVVGIAMQDGVAGDYIGMLPCQFSGVT